MKMPSLKRRAAIMSVGLTVQKLKLLDVRRHSQLWANAGPANAILPVHINSIIRSAIFQMPHCKG